MQNFSWRFIETCYNLKNNREKWFGYAGAPQSGDLFNAHSNSFHMLSGGAFQNSGNEWDPIPHHKIDFPRISLVVLNNFPASILAFAATIKKSTEVIKVSKI